MARVSYGSRAGTQTDYLVGTNEFHYSQSTHASLYASLQELADALQKDIASSLHSAVPECTTSELSIRIDALLPLIRPTIGPYANGGEHDLPPEFKQNWTPQDGQVLGTNGASVPQATIDSMLAAGEGQPRQIVQRAASRGIIQAIEQIDGFKYSFNNAWAAKDEDGLRFSYICQDSMQNKDRHANGFTKTQKHLKGDGHERGVRKPTYDCKGSVSVKFSGNRRCVDVYYRHYAIHSTVAERKPAPRPVPRRTRLSQVEGVEDAVEEEIRTTGLGERRVLTARIDRTSSTARPIKRKRDSGSNFAQVPRDPDATLSLAELLSQSAAASAPPPQSQQQLRLNDARSFPPPVDYSLPSWQTPLPIHQQPPRPRPIAASKSTPKSQYPPPYPATFTSPYPPPNSAGSKPPLNPMQSGTKSRDVVSRPLPTPPQQEYFGLPRDHIPQSQGLFSTLKPVAKDNFALQPHFVQYSGHRAKTSCRNCRIAKKKVRLLPPERVTLVATMC